MSTLSIILFISQVFAGISFTPEQCLRFQTEGITGGDYYINEALAHDCKIQVPEGDDGYFMNLALTEDLNYNHKKDCDLKSNKNLGDFKKVVTFNNMHPDYFYPDRDDEYPFSYAIQVPGVSNRVSVSNGVGVNINSVKGCKDKLESLLGRKIDSPNVIMTAGHAFVSNKGKKCRVLNKSQIEQSAVGAGSDISKYSYGSRVDRVVCSTNSCDKIDEDGYNDFCIVIPKKEILAVAEYQSVKTITKNEKTYLVGYQPTLITALKNTSIRRTERVISVNKDPLLTGNNDVMASSKEFIIHHADLAEGASGSGLFSYNKKLVAINIAEVNFGDEQIQRGLRGTSAVNYAIDPQIACERLSVVLK